MSFKKREEDKIEQMVFSKTLASLIKRLNKSYREIARDLNIAESTFFDMRNNSRSYKYGRLDRIARYFSEELNDKSITLSYLLLGNDKIRDEMNAEIEEIKKKLKKDNLAAAWEILELKQQISMNFKEEKKNEN